MAPSELDAIPRTGVPGTEYALNELCRSGCRRHAHCRRIFLAVLRAIRPRGDVVPRAARDVVRRSRAGREGGRGRGSRWICARSECERGGSGEQDADLHGGTPL